ncbi:hypothetical protein [Massilia cavernae]|uniref:Uncharacterized protein n=1 Tax=Massilia cavernae TaxID=2320864 RepID=A0A418XQ53_9BURK|nr:hypothetical protein [Massilia cavernae]RJG14555.1 hypothetical protein D3872_17410 [Massilia cavernae]
MKRLLFLSGFAAAMAFSPVALAQSDISKVTIPRVPETIELPAKYSRIWAGEFETLLGSYDLSNGDTLTLTKRVNRKYIQVGDMPKAEVVAVNDYDFVALDKRYRVVLQEPMFGDVTGYLLIDRSKTMSRDLSSIEPQIQSYGFAAR